jgi:uncharacterized protein (TIRG00374 family)
VRWNRRGIVGVAITVAALWWVLRQVSFPELWEVFRQSDWRWWTLSVVAVTAIFPLRAIRWRVILDPVASALPLGMLWRSTAIGMMVNNLLPLRAGEIARAYALTRETPRVGFAASFTSLAVDRVFDAVVLLLLLALGMLDLPGAGTRIIQGRTLEDWVGSGTIVVALVIGALYLVVVFPERVIGLYEAFARRVAPSIEARGRALLAAFASGLSVLRSPKRFVIVLGWTVFHWLVNALAFWCGFQAVGIDVSYSAALVVQGLIALGVATPSSPGFWGVFEFVAVIALTALYAIPADAAAAWAVAFHLLSFIPITVIGLYYLGRLDLRLGEIGRVTSGRAAGEDGGDTPSGGTPVADAGREPPARASRQ